MRLLAFGALALLAGGLRGAEPAFLIGPRDRVVIYGDSITAGVEYQYYPRSIEAYVRTRYPGWQGEIWNRGVSGDTAGNLERFRKDCLALKPDLVLFNMGMNDGGASADPAVALRRFVTNVTTVATTARAADPRLRLVLVSPILYETRGSGAKPQYAYVLRRLAGEERDLARRLGLPFIDLNRDYGRTIGMAEALFPGTTSFSADGIHPATAGGHLFIAIHILKGLGAGDELADVHLDARRRKAVAARGADVRRITATEAGGLAFERTLKALPFPIVTETGGVPYRDRAVAWIEEAGETFNADRLRVTHLPAGAYTLRIDGRAVATVEAEALADGINLAWFHGTPDQEQAVAVSEAVGRKQKLQAKLWRFKGDDAERAALEVQCREAVEEIGRLGRPAPHQVALEPAPGVTADRYRRGEQLLGIKGPGMLACDADGVFRQTVTVAVTNFSPLPRRVELMWEGPGAVPAAIVTNLPAAASCTASFALTLPADAPAPRLLVRHLPEDLSFPALVQTVQPSLARLLTVPRGKADTTADGNLAEWDGPAAVIDFEPCFTATARARRQGPADCGGVAKLRWNERGFALGVAVSDQDHVSHFTDPERVGWDDHLSVSLAGKSFSFVLAKEGPVLLPAQAAQDGVAFAVRREGLSTVYEAFIPWKAAGIEKAEAGAVHPFNLSLGDRDSDESERTMSWSNSGKIRLQE